MEPNLWGSKQFLGMKGIFYPNSPNLLENLLCDKHFPYNFLYLLVKCVFLCQVAIDLKIGYLVLEI